MSSRSWLSYVHQRRFHLTPLSYESLEYASGFASEQCPEGIVAISGNTLRLGVFWGFGIFGGFLGNFLEFLKRFFELLGVLVRILKWGLGSGRKTLNVALLVVIGLGIHPPSIHHVYTQHQNPTKKLDNITQNHHHHIHRILAVEKLGVVFNQSVTPLQYTPRRLEIHPPSQGLILIEADHNTYTEDTKDMRKKQMAKVGWWRFWVGMVGILGGIVGILGWVGGYFGLGWWGFWIRLAWFLNRFRESVLTVFISIFRSALSFLLPSFFFYLHCHPSIFPLPLHLPHLPHPSSSPPCRR